ncbi:hypothetical protein BC939DRAFT_472248 [Gamsiella multidivaricata]|uniref:uncharacterized protein n=1 Tax=Gamsiella multidivaricata TaxID=101098 RepID=UPI00221F34AF|nr:uncharacterized protein BC939DRAFT_472248 [Gamsiella multidivaricata]KAI7832652.1 hypothetical protein BC939DRAFT_472248 [Gamsiella multidivaricata]
MAQLQAAHFSRASTSKLAASLAKPASFKLLYWPINALGTTSREMLEYGGAKWENLSQSPDNWGQERLQTPFHVLPVLYIKTEDENDLVLSEAIVVEHYLAKQFSLLGDNEYEENLIKMFHNSSHLFQAAFAQGVTLCSPDVKERQLAAFLNNTLPTWIQTHEKHLHDNGNNGHYVGEKLSLADIRTAVAIEHLTLQPQAAQIMEVINKSEPLIKVKETVAKDPKIAAWRASEQGRKLTEASKAFFTNPPFASKPPPKN